jgi:hypothetical protein
MQMTEKIEGLGAKKEGCKWKKKLRWIKKFKDPKKKGCEWKKKT